jgi:hypothetical protein
VAFARCEVVVGQSAGFAIDQVQPLHWVRSSRSSEQKPEGGKPKRVKPKAGKLREDRPGDDRAKENKPADDRAGGIVPRDRKPPTRRSGQAQRKYSASNSQRFEVAIGDARSTHVEIRSPDPANLTVTARRTHIEVGGRRLDPLSIFDATSYAPDVQHLYTTMQYPQVAQVIRNNIEPQAESSLSEEDRHRLLEAENVALRVSFSLRSTLKWLHAGTLSFTILAIGLVGLTAGLRLFGKANTYTGNLAYFLVFLAFALAASLFTLFPLRDSSPLVTARLEVVKKLQLLSLVLLWAVTIVSLIVLA